MLARDTRGRPDPPLDIAALVRRGELVRALEAGDVAIASLDRRADLLFRSVLARDLARACIGTGELERAGKMVRLAETAGNEPGLAALGSICDAERARLAEAEGDLVGARQSIGRAYLRIPGSPFVAVDRDVMNGQMPAPLDAQGEEELPAVARAYALLRSAELLLANGELDEAIEAVDLAEHYYATARLWHETARARLARAEALVRSHGESKSEHERAAIRDRAVRALDACQEIAAPHGYVPIVVGVAIVRAALEEATGDLVAAAKAIGAAVLAAGDGCDASLARAARRLGAVPREARGGPNPYAARVERLGLARTCVRIPTRRPSRSRAPSTSRRGRCAALSSASSSCRSSASSCCRSSPRRARTAPRSRTSSRRCGAARSIRSVTATRSTSRSRG